MDGMDVMAVRGVAMEAIARARRGDGPTLIEAETYRFRGHSLADPDELRDPGEHLLRCNFWDATLGCTRSVFSVVNLLELVADIT